MPGRPAGCLEGTAFGQRSNITSNRLGGNRFRPGARPAGYAVGIGREFRRVLDRPEHQSLCRRRRPGFRAVSFLEQTDRIAGFPLVSTDLEQSAHDRPDHSVQKSIGGHDEVPVAFEGSLFPGGMAHAASSILGFTGHAAKRGKIVLTQQMLRRPVHGLEVRCRKQVQPRVPLQGPRLYRGAIPVRPTDGAIPGVEAFRGGNEPVNRYGAWQNPVQLRLQSAGVDRAFKGKMRHLARRVYPGIGPAGTHHPNPRPQGCCKSVLKGLLDSGHPRLGLPAVPPPTVVLYRQSVNRHSELLNPPTPHTRVFLTGFMGAGKSTIGPSLAVSLGWRFVDVDDVIEDQVGMTIPELFDSRGEAHFREVERAVVSGLAAEDRVVVALGGGAFVDPVNRQTLTQLGLTVWLMVPADILAGRLAPKAGARPLLQGAAGEALAGNALRARIENLLQARRPAYAQADIHFSPSVGSTPEHAAEQLREILREHLSE